LRPGTGFLAIAAAAALACQPAARAADDKNVAAEIGGQKVTTQEMDDYLRKTNAKAFQDFYDARHNALQSLINDRLLTAEATTRGTTLEKLKADLAAGVAPTTDADIEAFYNQNKNRMGNATLDQVKGQIKDFLAAQKTQKATMDLLDKLKAKTPVRILLDPPRVQIAINDSDPSVGPKDAAIQLIEYSDFQ